MAYIAFDDTDSRSGGCTTHVAFETAGGLEGLDLIGYPELVRLNPNVPFRTRGNGAVALRVGHGIGTPQRIGVDARGKEIVAYTRGEDPSAKELAQAFRFVRNFIDRERRREAGTEPGIIAGFHVPPESFYWAAVQTILKRSVGERAAREAAEWVACWEGGRGLLGAAAAAAWRGEHDVTFEAIAYRRPERIGTPRDVEPKLVAAIDQRFPTCFDSWDPVHRVARAVPGSPCPVLAGVRGESAGEVARAVATLGPEEGAGFLTFRTNQATDDHLRLAWGKRWAPYSSYLVSARVSRKPHVLFGGHTIVPIETEAGAATVAAAYEPTKFFRSAVRGLSVGDEVVAAGSFHNSTETLALEKLVVVDAADEIASIKPRCASCGGSMHSKGEGAGFRCRQCGARAPSTAAATIARAREGALGVYEVPVCARRHLAKPLARGGNLFGIAAPQPVAT